MELIKVNLGNAEHKLIKGNNYQVISRFIDDNVSGEVFNFDTLEEASKHLDNEVNTHFSLLNELENTLLKALELSEKLNLDISENLHEIIDNLQN